jgi:hypothetical protein
MAINTKRVVVAVLGLASLMLMTITLQSSGSSAAAPPCFTFADGIQAFQCPASFRPQAQAPSPYYSNVQNLVQTSDNGDVDRLPMGFFDQQTIDRLRQNAAQNQTVTTNNNNATAAATAASTSNLSTADIEAVRNGLNATRESLEHNDTQAAIQAINRADGALFALISKEGPGPVRDQLRTLSNDTDTIRESVFNLNNEKALADLNAAEAQLAVITKTPTFTPTPTPTPKATQVPEPLQQQQQEQEQQMIREDMRNQNQTQTNSTIIIPPKPKPQMPIQNTEPTTNTTTNIKIPLNKTQQEIITIEEIGNINKTTHEKTTISIIEGNRTTHREITTTEVPL